MLIESIGEIHNCMDNGSQTPKFIKWDMGIKIGPLKLMAVLEKTQDV